MIGFSMSPLLLLALALMPTGLLISGLQHFRGRPVLWAEPLGLIIAGIGALIAACVIFVFKAPDFHWINLIPVISISIGLGAMLQRRRAK